MVVGLDEVGRGPLAGPVVACAVFVEPGFSLKGVNDSKLLSVGQREKIYMKVKKDKRVQWGTARISNTVIDKINILEASKLAMKKAIETLERKIKKRADYLLIDGNFNLDIFIDQQSVVGGDGKVFSIALASIIAKVERDRLMQRYHKKYPEYGFTSNKGYPTRTHKETIGKLGLTVIHRKSFKTG